MFHYNSCSSLNLNVCMLLQQYNYWIGILVIVMLFKMIYKRYLGAYIAHCWTFPLRICFTLNRRGGNLQDKNGLTFFFVQTYIWGIGQWCQWGWKMMKCCFMILVLWKDTKQRGYETNVVQFIVWSLFEFLKWLGKAFRSIR